MVGGGCIVILHSVQSNYYVYWMLCGAVICVMIDCYN